MQSRPTRWTLAEGWNTIQHHGKALVCWNSGTDGCYIVASSRRVMLTVIDTQLDGFPCTQNCKLGVYFGGYPTWVIQPITVPISPLKVIRGLRAQSKICPWTAFPCHGVPRLTTFLTLIPSRANQWETLRNLVGQILPLPRRWIKKQAYPPLKGFWEVAGHFFLSSLQSSTSLKTPLPSWILLKIFDNTKQLKLLFGRESRSKPQR